MGVDCVGLGVVVDIGGWCLVCECLYGGYYVVVILEVVVGVGDVVFMGVGIFGGYCNMLVLVVYVVDCFVVI